MGGWRKVASDHYGVLSVLYFPFSEATPNTAVLLTDPPLDTILSFRTWNLVGSRIQDYSREEEGQAGLSAPQEGEPPMACEAWHQSGSRNRRIEIT